MRTRRISFSGRGRPRLRTSPKTGETTAPSLFDVWTTSPPGCFLPEEIAAGRVQIRDLVFGFSIPRSVAPPEVYRQMLTAARYAPKRLGGGLMDGDGEAIDESAAIAGVEAAVSRLREAGIEPGSEVALRLF